MSASDKPTGLSSPTEPSSTVSALTGFDPSRFKEAVGSIVSMCADARDGDKATAFDAVTEAVNELYGCIEDDVFTVSAATPYSFCWTDWTAETLEKRALGLAKSMASVKCKNKYPVGVIGAEARAHYTEARRIAHAASAIEARSDATGTGAAEGESAASEAGDAR